MKRVLRSFRVYVDEEAGTTSVAFAIWMPFLFGLIVMITDISVVMFNRADVQRVIQDANRLRATGALASNLGVEDYIRARLLQSDGEVAGTVQTAVNLLSVTSVVDIPLSRLDVFGVLPRVVGDITIRVANQQALEFMEI
ncbi:hypothetical protein HKCCSP123_05410 [Rhodobacterales bacterium HKCCSP123]|nr:hypothetical protein [Rhodobacterales bacterium HKCCSP123]